MLPLRDLLGPVHGTREFHRRQVLVALLIKADTQTRLADRTGLSGGTVSTIVSAFQRENIVRTDPGAPRGGGKRGATVRLRPAAGVAVGVYIGFNQAVAVARQADRDHHDVSEQRIDSGAGRGLEELLPAVQEMIEAVVADTGGRLADVVSLGVAVPGMLDPRTNQFATPVLPLWQEGDDPAAELQKWLHRATGVTVPVVQDNDANLAALAEHTYETQEHDETLVFVKASTGVGAGVVVGSRLIRGERGMAGEIGHLTVRPQGDVCFCGGRGCLNTVIGSNVLLREVRESRPSRSADYPRDLLSLITMARAGDAVCRRVLTDAGHTLGFVLAQVCNFLNPNLIVLGGQLAAAGESVLDPCLRSMRRHALPGAVPDGFRLKPSALDRLAEAQGALVLGLSRYATRG
ncbi:ROK family protein [Streptomyces sp. YIM 98790]|uniref:ROK family protein n=1 Tax=Streptomyces sp. YIM 98790 TaxID=2689077 RepID=UPI0014073D0B|nr:ROK family protein [Streptomyces sp. YIM 98790]